MRIVYNFNPINTGCKPAEEQLVKCKSVWTPLACCCLNHWTCTTLCDLFLWFRHKQFLEEEQTLDGCTFFFNQINSNVKVVVLATFHFNNILILTIITQMRRHISGRATGQIKNIMKIMIVNNLRHAYFFSFAGSDMAIFCLLCGKRFQTQIALQQHMEVHAGVRSYICSECNRTFPSHTALKRHLRSHTGQWKRPLSIFTIPSFMKDEGFIFSLSFCVCAL